MRIALITLGLICLLGDFAHAAPAPLPVPATALPMPASPAVRIAMQQALRVDLARRSGFRDVRVAWAWALFERDGGLTTCGVASFDGGTHIFIIQRKPPAEYANLDAGKADYEAAGCARPGAVDLGSTQQPVFASSEEDPILSVLQTLAINQH